VSPGSMYLLSRCRESSSRRTGRKHQCTQPATAHRHRPRRTRTDIDPPDSTNSSHSPARAARLLLLFVSKCRLQAFPGLLWPPWTWTPRRCCRTQKSNRRSAAAGEDKALLASVQLALAVVHAQHTTQPPSAGVCVHRCRCQTAIFIEISSNYIKLLDVELCEGNRPARRGGGGGWKRKRSGVRARHGFVVSCAERVLGSQDEESC